MLNACEFLISFNRKSHIFFYITFSMSEWIVSIVFVTKLDFFLTFFSYEYNIHNKDIKNIKKNKVNKM